MVLSRSPCSSAAAARACAQRWLRAAGAAARPRWSRPPCAGAAPRRRCGPEPPPGPRRVALQFELNGRKFPLPLVHGTVAGEPVWMLVDTGANSHVIASWVARKVGLSMRALGDVGSDHTGRAVSAYTVEHPAVTIDDWGPLADGPMLVTDVPEPIERIGIGAFVSPQWLAGRGTALVLDLPRGDAHGALGRRRRRRWTRGRARRSRRGAPGSVATTRAPSRVSRSCCAASVDGHGVDLLLDTGAHRTDLLTTSAAGAAAGGAARRPAASRCTPPRASSRRASCARRRSRIGDWSLTSDIDLVPGVADPLVPARRGRLDGRAGLVHAAARRGVRACGRGAGCRAPMKAHTEYLTFHTEEAARARAPHAEARANPGARAACPRGSCS